MKRGEAGLTMLISVIVIIIILTQYLIFFVFLPNRNIISSQYIGSESDLLLINFVKLNSDLIVKSVRTNNYMVIEEVIKGIKTNKCIEININDRMFSNCNGEIKTREMSIISTPDIDLEKTEMTIPDHDNNQIKITLLTEKG